MPHWYFLPITGLTALLNRLWRGEGAVPRWVWYTFMVVLAVIIAGKPLFPSIVLAVIWLIYFLGYALEPWQCMFSAITGEQPSRIDSGWIDNLRKIALKLCGITWNDPNVTPAQWRRFGVVYGTLRAALMIPGILGLALFYHSLIPLAGLAGLLMGLVYYGGYRLALHFQVPISMGVPFAEITMGWWHGTYMLIAACA